LRHVNPLMYWKKRLQRRTILSHRLRGTTALKKNEKLCAQLVL
jgi:hypothetical protein